MPNELESQFYVAGGTLRADAPCYVERAADRELFSSLNRGEFCYVLTARQMGKSSLMIRTVVRLREHGTRVVVLDLTALGENLTAEQWYGGLLGIVGLRLDLEEELESFWQAHPEIGPLRRWMRALEAVVLGSGVQAFGRSGVQTDHARSAFDFAEPESLNARTPERPSLVIFIDEIDAVRSLPFSTDEFFAAIRECYNRRSQDPAFERLTFCLLGVATPSDLIRDTRLTPFNIGRRIELTDFTPAEAAPLASGLIPMDSHEVREEHKEQDAKRAGEEDLRFPASPIPHPSSLFLQRILYWTGGHPYLTQRLCQALAAESAGSPASLAASPNGAVDRQCEALFLSAAARERDDNLLFVRERLLHSEAELASLLHLYGQVWSGKRVRVDSTNRLFDLLRLSGITRVTDSLLRVRNRIYERVFDPQWIAQNMPDAELRRQRAAYWRGLWRAAAGFGVVVTLMGGMLATAVKQTRLARRATRSELQQRRAAQAGQRALRRNLYASQVNLAAQALEAANTDRALELLNAQRPAPGQEDLRGFEWRFLWGLAQRKDDQFTLRIGHGSLLAVRYSPDGKTLATGTFNGSVALWNSASHRLLGELKGQTRPIDTVDFSPDGKLLATNCEDGAVRLWEIATRRLVRTLTPSGPLAFSPDGKWLAVAGRDVQARLWEVATGRLAGVLKQGNLGALALGFFPNGRVLATADKNRKIRLWSLHSRRVIAALTSQDTVYAFAISPNGKLLAASEGFAVGAVRLWSLPRREPLATFHVPRSRVNALAFSPDGRWLATAGDDSTVRLWSMAARDEVATLRGHQLFVNCIAFSPDGQTLVSGGEDETVRFWRPRPRSGDLLIGDSQPTRAVAFSRDGRRLAVGHVDGVVALWDVRATHEIARVASSLRQICSIAFSPDGQLLAAEDPSQSIKVWAVEGSRGAPGDGRGLRLREVLALAGKMAGRNDPPYLNPVAFSPDGKLLAWGRNRKHDYTLRLWDLTAQKEVGALKGHTGPIGWAAFSPDGRTLAVPGGQDRTVRLWSHDSNGIWIPAGCLRGYQDWAGPVAFSGDGRILATASSRYVRIWELPAKRELASLRGFGEEIDALGFTPDGRSLITSCQDGSLKFWSSASWTEAATLTTPKLSPYAVAISPDGNTLASGRSDGGLQLWHAPTFDETDWHVDRSRSATAASTGR